jgi:hypothetical protein
MSSVCAVFAPVTQRSSVDTCPGSSGNLGRAARVNHGDIQRGRGPGVGEGSPQRQHAPPTASRCNTNVSVTGLSTRIAACASRDMAESLLPVIVPVRAALA